MLPIRSHACLFAAAVFAFGLLYGAVADAAEPGEANTPHSATSLPAVRAANRSTTVVRRGAWYVATSANFQICSLESDAVAVATADACEALRGALAAKCSLQPVAWRPRCHVVLHANTASYEATVGAGGRATLASALVKRAHNGVALRQIDVRGDVADFLTAALPHELCHVLLADRLHEPPLWCDEGLALQFDSLEKQQLHDRDLRRSIASGKTLPLETLLTLRQYPAAEDWPAFYGQSASLVRCLLKLGDAKQLVEFAELHATRNVNAALHEVYGLHGCDELDRIWLESLHADLAMPLAIQPQRFAPPQSTPAYGLTRTARVASLELAATSSPPSTAPAATGHPLEP